ncbi:hypothetical protein H6P81_001734 [Aristolochia fimbriata]|uniref:Pentatricopeptide repeat-containing protein n=1 Tax=Aristolochia fimbriata TaxID=158543 RepID=A0AAV7FAY4_ARIFI|nr:hypothetical protein H6P81_001734 [Aristolochia fimbriata]
MVGRFGNAKLHVLIARCNLAAHAAKRFSLFSSTAAQPIPYLADPMGEDQLISDRNKSAGAFYELDKARVIGILRNLRKEPNTALSFFYYTKDHGFPHDVDSYAMILQILCTSGLNLKLRALLEQMVSSQVDMCFDIVAIFDSLSQRGWHSGAFVRVFDILVKVYVDFGMYQKAIGLFFHSGKHAFCPHERSGNFLLNSLIDRGKLEMARAFFNELKRLKLHNVYSFTILIKLLCKERNLVEATNILKEMEDMGVKPDPFTYVTLIHGMCSCGRSDLAYQLLLVIRNSGMEMGNISYNVVISAFCKEAKLEEAEVVLEDMRLQGVAPDVHSYSSLIYEYCKCRNFSRAFSLYDEMVSKDIKIICSAMINGYCEAGYAAEANRLFISLFRQGVCVTQSACSNLVISLCKEGEVVKAFKAFEMLLALDVTLDELAYSKLIATHSREGNMTKAWQVYQNSVQKGVPTDVIMYTALINGFCKAKQLREANTLFIEMKAKGIKPDVVTFTVLLDGNLKECINQAVAKVDNEKETGVHGSIYTNSSDLVSILPSTYELRHLEVYSLEAISEKAI